MSAKRSNTVLSNPASTRSTKDIVYELEEEFSDDINKKLGKNQEEKYNVRERERERLGIWSDADYDFDQVNEINSVCYLTYFTSLLANSINSVTCPKENDVSQTVPGSLN